MENEQQIQSVTVVGLGYIGLPTASLLATKGYRVNGCDIDPEVVATINRGDIHIVELDLDVLVRSAVNSGQLTASIEPAPADVFIIAVPTPFAANHVPDLRCIEEAVKAIATQLKPGNLLILESTSPVGTTEKIAFWLSQLRPDLIIAGSKTTSTQAVSEVAPIYIAHCPERVLPGQIIHELVENDRIIGGIDNASTQAAQRFYRSFVHGHNLLTDARTAELAKLAENAFRDVNIAFANELANICDHLDINVWELIKLANHHPRVNILAPGPGVGGHCIAVDPWFIIDSAPEKSLLIRAARQVNKQRPEYIVNQVTQLTKEFTAPKIACLGLSYKADIDDLRESPAVWIVERLACLADVTLYVVEPHVDRLPTNLQGPNTEFCPMNLALNMADIVILLVDHLQFKEIPPDLLVNKKVIDTRGIWA